jgi:hypothetical protein
MFLNLTHIIHKYPLVGVGLNETEGVFENQILIVVFGTNKGAKERYVKFHNEKVLRFWSSEELSNDDIQNNEMGESYSASGGDKKCFKS